MISITLATLLLAPTLLSSVLAVPLPVQAERGFAVGQRLPELVLPTLAGDRNVALSDLRGKRLLLIQFASW